MSIILVTVFIIVIWVLFAEICAFSYITYKGLKSSDTKTSDKILDVVYLVISIAIFIYFVLIFNSIIKSIIQFET